jgi:hypothetical protein
MLIVLREENIRTKPEFVANHLGRAAGVIKWGKERTADWNEKPHGF